MTNKLRWSGKASDFVEEYYLDDPDDTYGLFHVTPRLSEILRSGKLKSRKDLGGVGTLGGGSDDSEPHMVSITYSAKKAFSIFNEFVFMSSVASGSVSARDALRHIYDTFFSSYEKIEESIKLVFNSIANFYDEELIAQELERIEDEFSLDHNGIETDCLVKIKNNNVYTNFIFNEDFIIKLARNNHEHCDRCNIKMLPKSSTDILLDSKDPCFVFDAYKTVEQTSQKLQDLYGNSNEYDLPFCSPVFMLGFESIKNFRRENVGIVVLNAILGSKTSFRPYEKELRFHPEDIEIMDVIELQ